MARTLDHISGGRAILGIGSGWFERDYREYGYPFGTVQSRLHDFEEALDRIDARLGKLNPGPVNGSLPILIGGSGEKVMLRLVAQHAKIWHAFGDVETIAHKGRVLNEWCEKVGRDPSELIRSTTLRDAVTPELVGEYIEKAGMNELVVSSHGPRLRPRAAAQARRYQGLAQRLTTDPVRILGPVENVADAADPLDPRVLAPLALLERVPALLTCVPYAGELVREGLLEPAGHAVLGRDDARGRGPAAGAYAELRLWPQGRNRLWLLGRLANADRSRPRGDRRPRRRRATRGAARGARRSAACAAASRWQPTAGSRSRSSTRPAIASSRRPSSSSRPRTGVSRRSSRPIDPCSTRPRPSRSSPIASRSRQSASACGTARSWPSTSRPTADRSARRPSGSRPTARSASCRSRGRKATERPARSSTATPCPPTRSCACSPSRAAPSWPTTSATSSSGCRSTTASGAFADPVDTSIAFRIFECVWSLQDSSYVRQDARLETVARRVVGVDKGAYGLSFWGADPLAPEQLRYAALDALALLDIAQATEQIAAGLGCEDQVRAASRAACREAVRRLPEARAVVLDELQAMLREAATVDELEEIGALARRLSLGYHGRELLRDEWRVQRDALRPKAA